MLSLCRRSLSNPSVYCAPSRGLSTSGYATPTTPLLGQVDSQSFKLPHNRLLGFAEYGALNGNPLLYFHGLPSSRLECAQWDSIAKKLNVRLIGADRPGMGISTFQNNRQLLDWPKDVLSLADHLRLNEFRVMGTSGGSPYALACAYALPSDRLKGVGVLAGSGPWEAGTKGLPTWGRAVWNIWAWAPWTFKAMYERTLVRMAQDPNPESLNKMWGVAMEKMREKDRSVFEDVRIRKFAVEGLRAAFVQGVEGPGREVELITRPWGFNLKDIGFEGVKLWYGDEDANTPLRMGRYMVEKLPGAKLSVYPGDTHFTVFEKGEDILKEMMDLS